MSLDLQYHGNRMLRKESIAVHQINQKYVCASVFRQGIAREEAKDTSRRCLSLPLPFFRNTKLVMTTAVYVCGRSLLSIFLLEVYHLSSGVTHLLGRAAYLTFIVDCLSLHCNHQIEFGVDGEWCE